MSVENGRSSLVSLVLRGAWRTIQPELDSISIGELDEVTPLLYDSGAVGLGWWRLRHSPLSQTSSGELLHQGFRLLTLQGAIHEARIVKVFRAFRAANVEPIVVKGWAIARLYPEKGLRPYGDIDLLIEPKDHLAASRVTEIHELRDCRIDLHPGSFEVADRSIAGLYARSKLVPCGGEMVRVLGNEDHLAWLAVHFLKHAGWRPLWLCDVGLMLESISGDFDWDVCLGPDNRRVNWILSVIGLAQELLGASVTEKHLAARVAVPAWLIENVLSNWEQPFIGQHEPHNHYAPMRAYLRSPRGIVADLMRRWPDPILATISVNGFFGKRRRVRYQIRNCLQRAARLVVPVEFAHPNT